MDLGLKFLIESSVGGDYFVSDKRDSKVFMEGIIGDMEVRVSNFE